VSHERRRIEPRRPQPFFGAGQLEWVHVEADQPSAWSEAFQNRTRMAAETERAVDRHLTRPGRKQAHDILDHDRAVRTGRGLARGQHLPNACPEPLRVQLLVFLVERARIFSGVATAARPPGLYLGWHPAGRVGPAAVGDLRHGHVDGNRAGADGISELP